MWGALWWSPDGCVAWGKDMVEEEDRRLQLSYEEELVHAAVFVQIWQETWSRWHCYNHNQLCFFACPVQFERYFIRCFLTFFHYPFAFFMSMPCKPIWIGAHMDQSLQDRFSVCTVGCTFPLNFMLHLHCFFDWNSV